MAFFYLAPAWFFGWGIVLELFFGVATALVALCSLKVYRLCEERECRVFGIAFTAMSVAYFVWSIVNIFAVSQIEKGASVISFQNISFIFLIAIYIHVVFFIGGLATLAYFTFGKRHHRLFALIVSLSIIVVIFSERVSVAFNFVSALLLFYVILHYSDVYKKTKDNRMFLVLAAFILLFIARAIFVFSTVSPLVYVADHFIELGGYALILISLLKAFKR